MYGSLSGLVAAQTKVLTAAHNTANANTEGFKKHRVILQEIYPEGVKASVEQIQTPTPVLTAGLANGKSQIEGSNVDLGEEAVNLIQGKRLFEANLNVIKTQNQMIGSLLDIVE